MTLKIELKNAQTAAMKDQDKVRLAALRLINDAIQKTEIDERIAIDDAGIIKVLAKLEKQRLESIEAFEKGGRDDLVAREEAELKIIREYLPQPLTPEELEAMVKAAIAEAGAQGPKEMGLVMKALKGKYEGRASGKDVSNLVKQLLN